MIRVLIADGSNALGPAVERALMQQAAEVRLATRVAETAALLLEFEPDLMLLGLALADGSAFDVLREVDRVVAAPAVIVIGSAAASEAAFRLAQRGVRAYLSLPVKGAALKQAIDLTLNEKPDLIPHLRAAVGLLSIGEIERSVRRTMIAEALGRSHGNRSDAAKLLKISRQLLQHMMRRNSFHRP